jgi:hypothetical protein
LVAKQYLPISQQPQQHHSTPPRRPSVPANWLASNPLIWHAKLSYVGLSLGSTQKKNESSGEEPTEFLFLLRRKVRHQNSLPMGFEPWSPGVPLRAQPLGYSPVLLLGSTQKRASTMTRK